MSKIIGKGGGSGGIYSDFKNGGINSGSKYSDETAIFEMKLFFESLLENFLYTLRSSSRYLEGPPRQALDVSKKNHDHTAHQSDDMSGKVRKF